MYELLNHQKQRVLTDVLSMHLSGVVCNALEDPDQGPALKE